MNYITAIGYMVLAFSASSLAETTQNKNPLRWSSRGLFVFGPLLLDFNKNAGVEVVLNRSESNLYNCSNKTFYCARGRNVNLVLPKKCNGSLRVGEYWQADGITTSVLYSGRENPPLKRVLATTYLIGSELNPNIVWTYRVDTGVNGVYFDSNNKENLVSMAKNGGTETLNKQLPSKKFGFYKLLTLDAFGYCTN